MKRDYELGFILSPEVNEEETRALLDRIEQIVANYDGQVVRVSQWGRRRLAYPIQRHRDGFYVFIDMILTPETVTELERILKVSESVLRHMTRRRDPKAVQKEREEREARAAALASAAEGGTETVQEPTTEEQTPAPEVPEVSEVPEVEEVPVLSEEDLQDVPPAIEETQTIEA